MVIPVLIGSSRARTSPGLSATLPYEGRAWAISAAPGAHESGPPLLGRRGGRGVRFGPDHPMKFFITIKAATRLRTSYGLQAHSRQLLPSR